MPIYLKAIFILGLLSLVHCPAALAEEAADSANMPRVVAAKFHADWCGSCRRMGSVFEDLAIVSEGMPVLFVELDLTDSRTRKQGAYMMSALGLAKVWDDVGAGEKTGFIMLIDSATKNPVGRLTADQDLKQMKAAVQEAVVSRGK